MTLAEIIEEGEYVIEKWAPEGTVLREVQGVPIRVATLERLLAIAEAAVVLRNAMGTDWPLSLRDEIAAFDAAAGEVPR